MLLPPGVIHFLRFSGVEHSDADRAVGIKQPQSQKLIFPIINNRQLAHLTRPALIANAIRK